ncbi:metalloprotease [Halobacteriales archaeon QS_4_69_34]|nr:MAG: metalloprotease [Halobacteriales archaeon QS_4_69_34]
MASFRIGSAFGIPVRVGLSFLLALPVVAWVIGTQVGQWVGIVNRSLDAEIAADALSTGSIPFVVGAIAAVGLFVGVVLHELGHSLVAMRYGYGIDSITLWFLGGIASLAEMPEDWKQELAVAIAGPVISVAVGLASYLAFLAVPSIVAPTAASGVLVDATRFVLAYLALMNVLLAGFNLLPGFPMDGGRVLRALLARTRPHARATQIAAEVGKAFAFLLGLLGLFAGNLVFVAIAFFIYVSASSEAQQVTTRAALEGVVVRDVMTPAAEVTTVAPSTSVADLLGRMLDERHTGYPVLDGGALVGLVTLSDTQAVRPVERDAYRVEEVMATDLYTIPADADAMSALTEMQSHGVGRLPVVDVRGEFAGIVSRTDLVTALDIIRSTGSSRSTPRATPGTPRRPEESLR